MYITFLFLFFSLDEYSIFFSLSLPALDRDGTMHAPLTIREDGKEIYVQGLSEYNVKSVGDTLQLLKIAENNRAVRETYMNQMSSRSHSIFTINVEYKKVDMNDGGGEISYKAKFNLVDLAGSEKWDTKRSMGVEHIAEMTNINLSLHTLGKCIASLAKASRRRNKERDRSLDRSGILGDDSSSVGKGGGGLSATNNSNNQYTNVHIPYRESKLTRLLQDSLGGNAKTFLIATISPARYNCDETISTLKFADRAKQVMVQATINEFRPVDHAVVKRLQRENELLRMLVRKLYEESGYSDALRQVVASPAFDSLALVNQLPTASMAASPILPMYSNNNSSDNNNNNSNHKNSKHRSAFQQDASTSISTAFLTSPTNIASPTKSSSKPAAQPSLQHGQSLQKTMPNTTSDHDHHLADSSRLEYILSLERALNKEQVHAQHLAKKNETLIKEMEAMKFTNMQLSLHSSSRQSSSMAAPPSQVHSSGGDAGAQAASLVNDTLAHIPETVVSDLNGSVTDLLRQNEELLTNTEHLQKTMQKFFKFQIEEDEMKREVLQVFEMVKRLKGYIAAQRVNEHFAALQALQESLKRLKEEASRASGANYPTGGSSSARKYLQPLPEAQALPSYHAAPSQSHAPHTWSPDIDSRASSASNLTSSRASSAAVSAPMRKSTMFKHQDFDFFEEGEGDVRQQYTHFPHHHQQQHQQQSHYRYDQQKASMEPTRQSGAHNHASHAMFPASSSHHNTHEIAPSTTDPLHYLANPLESSGGGISFRLRNGPSSTSSTKQPPSSSQPMRQDGPHHSSAETVASAESILGGLAILESEEEMMAREYKEAKTRQKKKEKLAQWMKEKEEKARLEQRLQSEERRAMLDSEREREAKRKEYAQKQKAKLNQYHDKVKLEAEKIQELINLGIDPKSLNL